MSDAKKTPKAVQLPPFCFDAKRVDRKDGAPGALYRLNCVFLYATADHVVNAIRMTQAEFEVWYKSILKLPTGSYIVKEVTDAVSAQELLNTCSVHRRFVLSIPAINVNLIVDCLGQVACNSCGKLMLDKSSEKTAAFQICDLCEFAPVCLTGSCLTLHKQVCLESVKHLALVAVPRLSGGPSKCLRCARALEQLHACPHCLIAGYCSDVCRSSDTAAHKPECNSCK